MYSYLAVVMSLFSLIEAGFIGLCIGYLLMIGSLLYGWCLVTRKREASLFFHKSPSVSLVIPFRNEASNLPQMMLQVDTGIPASWEVVWVDDHSEDASISILEDYLQKHQPIGWRVVKNEGIGKKRALYVGIAAARNEFIVTTDADILFHGNPFLFLVRELVNPETHMVIGPVFSEPTGGFFSDFQQIEWASIQLVTGVSCQAGAPLMCSGANLCFRRSSFFAVGGYDGNYAHPSGDDEFLLKKVVAKFGAGAVAYFHGREGLVYARPFEKWENLIGQRRRWVSKWRVHRSAIHGVSSVFSFLLPAFFVLSPLLLVTGTISLPVFGFGWFCKILADWLALSHVIQHFGLVLKSTSVILSTLVHPLFVVAVGVGVAPGKYTWKGRKSDLFY
jgi:biofilm PGA synthesis N-glycosyltransferase PgaC